MYISSPIRTVDLDVGGFKSIDLSTGSEDDHNDWTSNVDWADARLVPETANDWPDGPRDHTNGIHTYSANPGNGTMYTLTCRDASGTSITQNVRVEFVRTPMGVILSSTAVVPRDPDPNAGVGDGLMDINKQAEVKYVVGNADGCWWNYPGGDNSAPSSDGAHKFIITNNPPYALWVGLNQAHNIGCWNNSCINYCSNICGASSGKCYSDCSEFYSCRKNSWYHLKVRDCSVSPCSLPTATLTANPNPINAGNASALTWVTSNATSCWASGGNAGDGWQNTDKAWFDGSHSFSVYPTESSNRTYSIECWNDNGDTTGLKSVTIGLLGIRCAPDTSCAADTCIGATCDDGCGGTVAGSKNCTGVGGYMEVSP